MMLHIESPWPFSKMWTFMLKQFRILCVVGVPGNGRIIFRTKSADAF